MTPSSEDIQHALNQRGTVTIPAGRYTAPPGGFRIGSDTEVVGAFPGLNRVTRGTIFLPATPDDHAVVLLAGESDPAGNIRLENIIVRGADVPGNGCGFFLDTVAPSPPAHIVFERCMSYGVGADGFYIRHGANKSVDCLEIIRCSSCKNGRHGVYVDTVFWPWFHRLVLNANGGAGLYLHNCGDADIERCYADGNQGPEQFMLSNCMVANIARGNSERFYGRRGVTIKGGRQNRVGGMFFQSSCQAPETDGCSVYGQGTDSPYMDRCAHRNVTSPSQGLGPGNTAAQDSFVW